MVTLGDGGHGEWSLTEIVDTKWSLWEIVDTKWSLSEIVDTVNGHSLR